MAAVNYQGQRLLVNPAPQPIEPVVPNLHEALEGLGGEWDPMDDAPLLVGRVVHLAPQPDRAPLGAPAPEAALADEVPQAEAEPEPAPVAPPVVAAQPPLQPTVVAVAEPNLLVKIWRVFVGAIEAFVQFILTHVLCMPRSTTAAAQPVAQPPVQVAAAAAVAEEAPPEPEIIQVSQPVAPQEGRIFGTLNLHPINGDVYVDYCAREFLNTFWDQIGPNLAPEQIQPLLDQSLRNGVAKLQAQMNLELDAPNDFPRIQPINRFEERQDYTAQINAMHAPQNKTAAILAKGDLRHLILVDTREREGAYYHYNPHSVPISLQVFPTIDAIVAHLNAEVPIEEATPFRMNGYRLRP